MSEEKYGSAFKPLNLKCLSIGSPDPDRPYLCMVDDKGRQFYFRLTHGLNRLLHVQSGNVDDAWPETRG
jgi:hypothetical protein